MLDDWVRDLLRRRQVRELAAATGPRLRDADVEVLACGWRPTTAGGCLLGCLRSVVISPTVFLFRSIFRKLMRKVLLFLLVKDCVDTFSQTFHEGVLLRHLISRGGLPEPREDAAPAGKPDPRVVAARRAVEATCAEVDHRPIEKLAAASFRHSRRLLRRSARTMTRFLRRHRDLPEEQIADRLERGGEEALGDLIDELTAGLDLQSAYLRRLELLLERRLASMPDESPTQS